MSEPMEPLVQVIQLRHPGTGECFEVKITVEGHIDPMGAVAAVVQFAERLEQAAQHAMLAAKMVESGVPREVVEQMLGLTDEVECTCGTCDQQEPRDVEAELASIGSPTDEEWEQFARELNGP